MTGNPEYGTTLYDLMAKSENGDAALLDAYLAAIRRALCQQIADICSRFATSLGLPGTNVGTVTRRNPLVGPARQRERLS